MLPCLAACSAGSSADDQTDIADTIAIAYNDTGVTDDATDTDPPTPAIAQALTGSGFSLTPGHFIAYQIGDCCAEGASCYGNNPTSPYFTAYLPDVPGQELPGARRTTASAETLVRDRVLRLKPSAN